MALLHIIAFVAARSSNRLTTRFHLPTDEGARNYLRWRRFSQAIEFVTSVPFRLLVDNGWFAETRPPIRIREPITNGHTAIEAYLDEMNFFGFEHFEIGDEEDKIPVFETQARRWKDPLVMQLLKNRLPRGPAHDISRVVVQELLVNLLHTSAGGDVICVSQIDRPRASDDDHLTIAAWNAPASASVAELLKNFMQVIDRSQRPEQFDIEVDYQEPKQISMARLARYVSRRLHDEGPVAEPSEPPSPDPQTEPPSEGAGGEDTSSLGALYRFVVDQFAGQLDFWSGTSFVRITGHPELRYHIQVQYKSRPHDNGTIIAVRIPLRS